MLRSRAVTPTASSSAPPPQATARAAPRGLTGIPRNVVALGFVSLLTDVSTEMIIPVLPLFVTVALRASVSSLGLIEGVAEATASLLRIGSGWLSDRIGRRKPFLAFGYGLSTVAKGALAIAASWPAVLALRFADRVGKGLRNPPRDALIADSVEPRYHGRAFGLHRGLDTLGAAIGPLVAFGLLSAHPGDYRRVFLWSALPASLSILVLWAFVRAPRHEPVRLRALHGELRALGGPFHRFLAADGLFQLGNSSMAFVLLRTATVESDASQRAIHVSLAYLAYNLVYALLSFPLGVLSDRVGRRPLLLAGYTLYAAIYAWLARAGTPAAAVAGLLALGLQSALMEGQQRSLIADLVPADRRATAYGFYYFVVGIALLPASVIAGLLWDRFGAGATFGVDAALAALAALLFMWLLPSREEHRDRHHAHAA